MHYGWPTIVVANVLVAVYRALPAKLRVLGWPSIGWQDAMQVSGEALEEGRLWVLLTATVDHEGLPHLVNNMAMLALGAEELETILASSLGSAWGGAIGFVLLYFGTGAVGWLCSQVSQRVKHWDLWEVAAKFQTSVGSSSGTYGVASCFAFMDPRAAAHSAFGQPWWGLGVLMFAPFVCSAKYGLQPWVHIQDPPKNMKEEAEGRRPAIEGAGSSGAAATVTQIARCAAFLAFAVAFTEHALKPFCISARGNSSVFNGSNSGDRDDSSSSNSNNGSGKSDEGRSQRDGCNSDEDGTGGYLTSAQTFAIVLAWVVLLRFCDKMALGRSLRGGADHMCHFGGAFAGALTGLCLRFLLVQSWSQNATATTAASATAGDAGDAGDAGGAAATDSAFEAGACDATSVLGAITRGNSSSSSALPLACLGFLALRAYLDF